MNKITKSQFVSGTFWKIVETFFSVGTTFLISLVLARLLDPNDFGIIAITSIVISFSEIVLQSAFTTPLIQKERVENADYTSILGIGFAVATGLYIILFFTAPLIGEFYGQPILKQVLRVLGIMFFFQVIGAVRTAMITREMKFRTLSWTSFISNVLSGVVGIGMALFGFGIWSLVGQKLSQQLFLNIILFSIIKWKPEGRPEIRRVKGILGFGTKVLFSSLLSFFADSIFSSVSGKRYSVTQLGYFSKGTQYPCELSIYTFQAITTVLLPTLTSYKNDMESFRSILQRVIRVSAYLLFPVMLGVLAVSEAFTVVLLTDKWLPSLPFMKMACLYYCATPFMLINVQAFHALGNGRIRVVTECVRISLIVMTLVAGSFFKIDLFVLYGIKTLIEIFVMLLTFIPLKKSVGYGLSIFLKDILGPLVSSGIMCGAVSLTIIVLGLPNLSALLTGIGIGVVIYVAYSLIFKPAGFMEVKAIVNKILGSVIKKRKNNNGH